MFGAIQTKLKNMRTIRRLLETAEAHALRDRQAQPGAEHFLLAALDLPDGTARLAFQTAGASADDLPDAIERQYSEALEKLGIRTNPADMDRQPREAGIGLYRAAPSGQAVMQALTEGRAGHRPLLGAHVVAVVAAMPHGVAARAIRSMGIEASALQSAAVALSRKAYP